MISQLRVGVIGAGGIARARHIPGYLKNTEGCLNGNRRYIANRTGLCSK
ncbi:putative dehydrogenase [Paenibacillus eucommiae]|uniref:Dehydrogenase n=1 Tax=Paenibacillus eucommiae TaxID=1355755 RepID=A0ABS4J9W8_9BACL|nr:putative dehydrogenase [Paenibacillus eucommiae]